MSKPRFQSVFVLTVSLWFWPAPQNLRADDQPASLLPRDALFCLGSPAFRHGDSINSVCFSKDGKFIASGSDDKTLRLCEVRTAKEISRLPHTNSAVTGLFLSDAK